GDTKGPMTMIRLYRLGAIVAAIALSTGGVTRAGDKPPQAKSSQPPTHALGGGGGPLADKENKARPTADEDAKTIAGILTDKAIGGIPTDHVAVLLSEKDDKFGAKEGTKANILSAVGDAAKKVGKEDTLLIYMVMQGATAGEKPCL